MPEFVRVKVKDTGHKVSLQKSVVDANPDAYLVLKQDAVDTNGRPLPAEHATESLSSTTTSGQQADPKKES